MASLYFWRAALVSLLVGLLAVSVPASAQTPTVFDAYPDLSFDRVTDIQSAGDGSERVFVVEQEGIIQVFADDPSASQATTFLDHTAQVTCCGERGLLGLAFHPDYATNGKFFVNYTTTLGGQLVTRISEFVVSSDPDEADAGSETVLLEVDQPFGNHNAGQLQFGPDGYLYVGLGDGGSGGDPRENGQDPTTLLGTVMRLDVDGGGTAPDCGGGPAGYTIPPDNPFVDDDGACDEIYALGFRNPFRFSFGPDERLWVADVGQNSREEIDWVEAGGNYGWNTMEGSLCFDPSFGCDETGLELPVWEYSHDLGNSVTGGYVVPEGGCSYIEGDYVFADFGSGRIWRLQPENAPFQDSDLLLNTGFQISTFGLTPDGTLLVANYGDDASMYRFDCSTLPVELAAFEGTQTGKGTVQLSWTTASERNNAGFRIQHQRPTDGTWAKVGSVESKADGGTTSEPIHYRFQADGLEVGTHRFRLKQVDLDGTTRPYDPVHVELKMQKALRLNPPTPNPARGQATLSFAVKEASETTIRLYNTLGQRVAILYRGTPAAGESHTVRLDASTLPSGVYVVRLETDGQTRTRRLTIVR